MGKALDWGTETTCAFLSCDLIAVKAAVHLCQARGYLCKRGGMIISKDYWDQLRFPWRHSVTCEVIHSSYVTWVSLTPSRAATATWCYIHEDSLHKLSKDGLHELFKELFKSSQPCHGEGPAMTREACLACAQYLSQQHRHLESRVLFRASRSFGRYLSHPCYRPGIGFRGWGCYAEGDTVSGLMGLTSPRRRPESNAFVQNLRINTRCFDSQVKPVRNLCPFWQSSPKWDKPSLS